MEQIARLLVQQPFSIALFAATHAAIWMLLRLSIFRRASRFNAFWLPAILWAAYAAWEWLVLRQSPEANIRVDLLLIWPIVAVATLWALAKLALGLASRAQTRKK